MSNKATVTEERLQGAFQRGFDEGTARAGEPEQLVLSCHFEGTKLNQSTWPNDEANWFRLCVAAKTHLEAGVGASVTIERCWLAIKTPEAVSEPVGTDDDIVDAEVIEET